MSRKLDLGGVERPRARGHPYWRSLEELAGTPEFEERLRREFPDRASEWDGSMSRRQFVSLMSASFALAGLSACTRPPAETILPYSQPPEQIVPGRPLFFATTMTRRGTAIGLLVESHEGRPTKVEGNPDHPASLGATDVFAQASILDLYDPDRSQTVTYRGDIRSWSDFAATLGPEIDRLRARRGAGLRILTGTVVSPSLAAQLHDILTDLPLARWHQHEAISRDNAREGARLAFGRIVEPQYRFDRADLVLSLDADFMSEGPGCLRYTRDFTRRRLTDALRMNRLYVAEAMPGLAGDMADHRLRIRARQVHAFAAAVAGQVIGDAASMAGPPPGVDAKVAAAIAKDLTQHRGSSLVLAGERQPPAVHALAHALNDRLGNAGQTVIYTDPVEANPVNQLESFRELMRDIDAGAVDVLVVAGVNPAYTAPADFDFAGRAEKVRLRIHLGVYADETSALCHWHVPQAHYLESWGDARAFDGTASIVQPLIAPLYGGRTAHELLALFTKQPNVGPYDVVRSFWKRRSPGGDFELFWRQALNDGVVRGTAFQSISVRPMADVAARIHGPAPASAPPADLEVIFAPDPGVDDGAFANNGWLQELPRPQTRIAWDNAALFSPGTAFRLGIERGDLVDLDHRGRRLRTAAFILPGHADDSVTIHLGHGRRRAGTVGTGVGFNAYLLRASDALDFGGGLAVSKAGQRYDLVSTQNYHLMEGRHLAREGTLDEYLRNPSFVREMDEEPRETLYKPYPYPGYAWGMAIDINRCIGCGACVVACQAENNIPIVGKAQVGRGREMHWIRVDRYYRGTSADPGVLHQPVPCMHCENAPCELVCPVEATVHSDEGLNDMIYNRCIGTRYCSNNCPYKVRRFNFLDYHHTVPETLTLQQNPNVTVRSRGVMEKCTYCVQRISAGRIAAEKENRPVRDGEITPACAQACPAEAIVFGDINDPHSRVARLRADQRGYSLLGELNTRPRTTYLARLRNPNPEIESA